MFIYSLSGVFSKMASKAELLSWTFCACYGMVLVILMIYAIGWQQIIKRMPLSIAFANKAVTTMWGAFWGMTLFHEKLTMMGIIGMVLVLGACALVSLPAGKRN